MSSDDTTYVSPRQDARKTDAGSYVIDGEETAFIEFRIQQPRGMSKKCVCNGCWFEYYIAPFSSPSECPRCHSTQIGVERVVPSVQEDCAHV